MTNDELDEMTDAQLNELFAVEVVAVFKAAPLIPGDRGRKIVGRFHGPIIKRVGSQDRLPSVLKFTDGRYGGDLWPDYCGDANAVLPWLHVAQDPEVYFFERDVRVTITTHPREGRSYHQWVDGEAANFARAAVIALLRAKRAAK